MPEEMVGLLREELPALRASVQKLAELFERYKDAAELEISMLKIELEEARAS